MSVYLIKRLLLLIPTLFGITLISFFLMRLAPGDPAELRLLSTQGKPGVRLPSSDDIKKFQQIYGLNPELPDSYKKWITRWDERFFGPIDSEHPTRFFRAAKWTGKRAIEYKNWLSKLMKLDFGRSLKDDQHVIQKIGRALPVTLILNFLELLIVYGLAIPLSVAAAKRPNSLFDRFWMALFFVLYALPTFWVAYLLLLFFASATHLDLFPLMGLVSEAREELSFFQRLVDVGWHLVLPVTCMVYGSFAFLYRFSRNNLLEVLKQDYIRTARAKGLSERRVFWRHAFRNTLIPLVTLMGTLLPAMMAGSIIIEQIFSIPGMGKLTFEAILSRDYTTLMGILAIQSLLTLLSLLLADLAYLWVDPRISFEKLER